MTHNSSASILYIEDNEDNAYMLSRRLRRRGFNVEIAVDGETGLSMAISLKPEIILLDLNLPTMDGWEVTKLLRKEAATSTTPIIAISSHVLPTERENALRAGCTDYETKPIDFERLLSKIRNSLANAA